MEEEEVDSELNNSAPVVESATSTPLSEDQAVNLKETIQIDNSSLTMTLTETVETSITASENADIKKKKLKEEKPHSKIVVRRLPPTMSKEMFLEQVSPLPEVDYIYYIHGDSNNAVNPFSRAYLNFVNQEDLFSFSRTFDNYVFLDLKGQEYPAVIEFAMFQRIAKQRTKKKDPLMGTIEADPTFIAFKENLLAEALENSKTGGKAVKQHYFETEISTAEEVNTTPLLEFLKVRRAEKARMREERREEKKRKESERKLKQKTRDKKGEGEEEEVAKESKVLARDRRENKERETRTVKKRDEKERVEKTRVREFKSRGGKSYQEERLRLAERREEQKKRELLNSGEKKPDNTEPKDGDAVEVAGEHSKVPEEKTSRFEKKKFEYRKKYDDDWKDEKKRNRNEKNNIKRDGRDRKDDYRRNQDKRMSDSERRKLNKSYKNSEFSKASEDKKKSSPVAHEEAKEKTLCPEEESNETNDNKGTGLPKEKWKSVDDLVLESTVERKKSDNILTQSEQSPISSKKRHSSLGNVRLEETVAQQSPKKVTLLQREKPEPKENKDKSSNYRSRKDLSSHKSNAEIKAYPSKKKDRFYDKTDESKGSSESCSKNKMQDQQEGESTKNRDAPRPDRRIRNKDRPSIEIYRPGMGKFSKQRLEKERALGSSTEVDSPSHSPSPTPRANLAT